MAIIPLKQTVFVEHFLGNDPDYNEPDYSDSIPMKCRFQEGVQLVRNHHGQEVASVGSFYFDCLPRITIHDMLTYTNEIGTKTSYKPIAISVIRGLDGKPILTEVSV